MKNIKSYDFNKSYKDAKKTENLVMQFFISRGYIVEDVSENKDYMAQDIDLLVYSEKMSKCIKLEVKSDKTDTPNYFAETISNNKKNTLGCWLATKSDYIAYFFEKNKELHIIPTIPAQKYLKENYDKFKDAETSTVIKDSILYITKGKLIKKKELQENISITIIDLKRFIKKMNVSNNT